MDADETYAKGEDQLMIARRIRRSVAQLARRLRAERPAHAISLSKLSVLGRLSKNGPLTATDLAEQERIQPQSLTRLLADLEQRALVVRRQGQSDRRQVIIEITSQGSELLIEDARPQAAWLARAMSTVLSPVEQELLRLAAQLMQRLTDADPPATEKEQIGA
ncbi:MAG TPA: MarR family transcriptional regulator [Chthoniobacterales bacterium]|nr:MarR family transcriptional regulator [Chthoniobacterales bacterium]